MSDNDHDYSGENQVTSQNFLAFVESYEAGFCQIEQRNKFVQGDRIEILRAKVPNFSQTVEKMYNEDGDEITSAPHPKQKIRLQINQPVSPFDMIRRG
jgi:putative protease